MILKLLYLGGVECSASEVFNQFILGQQHLLDESVVSQHPLFELFAVAFVKPAKQVTSNRFFILAAHG